jgi:hypothetical protein
MLVVGIKFCYFLGYVNKSVKSAMQYGSVPVISVVACDSVYRFAEEFAIRSKGRVQKKFDVTGWSPWRLSRVVLNATVFTTV